MSVAKVNRSDDAETFECVIIGAAVEAGHARSDHMNAVQLQGFGPREITVEAGRRSRASAACLRQALKNPKLRLVTKSTVARILFDGATTTGGESASRAQAQSDGELDAFICKQVECACQPCGICCRGTDHLAVVGHDCRVIGLQNLCGGGASIMSQTTGRDLRPPTVMLAERAADIILQKLLPEAGEAPLMDAENWQGRQRSRAIAGKYALDRAGLCAVPSSDMKT